MSEWYSLDKERKPTQRNDAAGFCLNLQTDSAER